MLLCKFPGNIAVAAIAWDLLHQPLLYRHFYQPGCIFYI